MALAVDAHGADRVGWPEVLLVVTLPARHRLRGPCQGPSVGSGLTRGRTARMTILEPGTRDLADQECEYGGERQMRLPGTETTRFFFMPHLGRLMSALTRDPHRLGDVGDGHSEFTDALDEQPSTVHGQAGVETRRPPVMVKRQTPQCPEVLTCSGNCHQRPGRVQLARGNSGREMADLLTGRVYGAVISFFPP